ncbi:MAG: cytochrome c oxidase subunit [Solirubrobacterales bacterium]|jgi:cytochrome c oxidase subunit 1|nr:cytochrome c oxidase subunit [Solirubrobacterales bacterium]
MNVDVPTRPPWRRIVGFNLLTGLVLGVICFYVGWWIGHRIDAGSLAYQSETGQDDVALMLGYLGFAIGFMAGVGFARYPLSRLTGRELSHRENELGGIGRYFAMSTDHKVVGLQYLVGIGAMFFIAGTYAMMIRAELLTPNPDLWGPGNYLTIVGLHGTLMMGTATSAVLGPFANFFVPLMIGAKRMAFPRIEAASFWLLMAAGIIFGTAAFFGGFPTGWTGYAPLNQQANFGFDSYIFFFALVGASMTLLGLNMIVTIATMRAPGLTWRRLPAFCWGALITSVLNVLAAPVLIAALLMAGLDRTLQTGFYDPGSGGSHYLFENLFWFFGHPEVYILAIPGFAIILELLPVFARKPLWGYRLGVTGMAGVGLISFFVWQHHLFVSGINSDLRPFYMLSTEAISVPTALIFLCGMGTLWRGQIRFAVPMLFCLAWFFNFFIGGATGIFLSDVPTDVTVHGSFWVLAHFHYTIVGGLLFAFFAAVYYWVPKMTGLRFNETLAKVHFWTMFLSFNSTFIVMFVLGLDGMPRRVATYPQDWQFLNAWASVSAFVLGASMLVFIANVLYSQVIVRRPAAANPWDSKGLEWQLPTPVPVHNFDEIPVIDTDPYDYGTPPPRPVGGAAAAEAPG